MSLFKDGKKEEKTCIRTWLDSGKLFMKNNVQKNNYDIP